MKLIRKPNGYYDLLIKGELKSIEQFNITKEDCDILTLGYNVEKMAEKYAKRHAEENNYGSQGDSLYIEDGEWKWKTYLEGFKAHQELSKDKLFTLKDVINITEEAQTTDESMNYPSIEEILKRFIPKTEWEVGFDEQGKLKLL